MNRRRILYLANAKLAAYSVGGGTVEPEDSFTADESGLSAFAAYLRQHHGRVFMLLADVPEEGFLVEDIPHSSGKDRAAIVRRKLGQHFYGTPFALAHSQGRLKTGRRDERLLLMALTQPQHLDPWLDALRATQTILAGIYSLPQLLHHLLPANAPAQQLLITRTRNGLRQAYFANRQLRFSRLTPLATGSTEESAIAAALEAGKMHQYLASQRLIERGKPLATRVLVHPAQVATLRERCRDNPELRFEFADLLQEATRLGLKSVCGDSRAEILFCHLLEHKPPADQFAPPGERQYYRLCRIRSALQGASAALLAGALLFAGAQGLEVMQLREDIDRLGQQTQQYQRRYDETLQTLPKIPLSTDNLRALVSRYAEVARRAPGPGPLLHQLSQSLDAFPGINLEQIEWSIVEKMPPAPPGTPPVPAQLASGPYAQATVVAHLPLGMIGNQRSQLALMAEFVKHLGLAPDTHVAVLQPPVDTQSGKTLKSSDTTGTQEAPRFSFRLTRKL